MVCISKKTGILFIALCWIFIMASYEKAEAKKDFSDVKTSNSHYESIMHLNHLGVYDYKTEDIFSSNQSITRNEVARILYTLYGNSFEKERIYKVDTFADVLRDDPDYHAIVWAYEVGIFDGSNVFFLGADDLKRSELAKVLVNTFDLERKRTHPFIDVNRDHWAFDYVSALYSNGVTIGYKGQFMPDQAVTNGEFASFVYRTMKVTEIERAEDLIKSGNGMEAVVGFVSGEVHITPNKSHPFQAEEEMLISLGDTIQTDEESTANVMFENGSKLTIGKSTTVNFSELVDTDEEKKIVIDVIEGSVWNRVEKMDGDNDKYMIDTETSSMTSLGTLFLVTNDPATKQNSLSVLDGLVHAKRNQSAEKNADDISERLVQMNEKVKQDRSTPNFEEVALIDAIEFVSDTTSAMLAEITTDIVTAIDQAVERAKEKRNENELSNNEEDLLDALRNELRAAALRQILRNLHLGIDENDRKAELESALKERGYEPLQHQEERVSELQNELEERINTLLDQANRNGISQDKIKEVRDSIPTVPKTDHPDSSNERRPGRGGGGSQPAPKPEPELLAAPIISGYAGSKSTFYIEVEEIAPEATLTLYHANDDTKVEVAEFENGRFTVKPDGKSYYVTQTVDGEESEPSETIVAKISPPALQGVNIEGLSTALDVDGKLHWDLNGFTQEKLDEIANNEEHRNLEDLIADYMWAKVTVSVPEGASDKGSTLWIESDMFSDGWSALDIDNDRASFYIGLGERNGSNEDGWEFRPFNKDKIETFTFTWRDEVENVIAVEQFTVGVVAPSLLIAPPSDLTGTAPNVNIVEITFSDDARWRDNITEIFLNGNSASIPSSRVDTSSKGLIKIDFSGASLESGTHNLLIKAGGYKDATIEITLTAPPTLIGTVPSPGTVQITFSDDARWRDNITGIFLNGNSAPIHSSRVNRSTQGLIEIDFSGHSLRVGTHELLIKAEGYADVVVTFEVVNENDD